MSHLERAYYDLGRLELLAEKNSRIHSLDPRAKLLTTLFFIIYVVSFNKYEIVRILPFFFFPVLHVGMADLPVFFLLRKLMLVAPFVLFVGIFNPFLDREILLHVGSLEVSGGWLSLISIVLRFILTVGAALLLISTTGFPAICMALEKMGVPKILTVQLLLLYRYLFVLIEESIRMMRAYTLRSFSQKKLRLRIFMQLLGNLLLRTLDRAQRIHMAMLTRAFSGEIKMARQFRFGLAEFYYMSGWIIFLTCIRFVNISELIGKLILESR